MSKSCLQFNIIWGESCTTSWLLCWWCSAQCSRKLYLHNFPLETSVMSTVVQMVLKQLLETIFFISHFIFSINHRQNSIHKSTCKSVISVFTFLFLLNGGLGSGIHCNANMCAIETRHLYIDNSLHNTQSFFFEIIFTARLLCMWENWSLILDPVSLYASVSLSCTCK